MSTESEEHLAFEAVEAGDYERAKQLLRPLVRQGSTYARALVDRMWDPEESLASKALDDDDYERARELLIPLSHKGSAHAMHLLAWMHATGKMADSSKMSAIYYYRKAAEGGITRAYYNAGMLLLENGDKEEAKRVFEHGVDLGSMQCMYGLGACLAEGETDQERQQAIRWFEKAAAEGHIRSKRRLLEISARKSLFGRIMFIPRLLKLIYVSVESARKYGDSERIY